MGTTFVFVTEVAIVVLLGLFLWAENKFRRFEDRATKLQLRLDAVLRSALEAYERISYEFTKHGFDQREIDENLRTSYNFAWAAVAAVFENNQIPTDVLNEMRTTHYGHAEKLGHKAFLDLSSNSRPGTLHDLSVLEGNQLAKQIVDVVASGREMQELLTSPHLRTG